MWRHDFFPMIDLGDVADVYVSGLGSIEILENSTARFTWCTSKVGIREAGDDRIAVSKLLIPVAIVSPTLEQIADIMYAAPIEKIVQAVKRVGH